MPESPQRQVLPIPDITPAGLTTFDAKDPATAFPPIEPLRPPEGAPNVLIVLIDDVGFGASSAFGGPISTPTAEKLAANGLKYNRFHTTALCSPTRQALLTGRNHHTVGMGGITEIATSAPGYNSIRPNTCAPLPETLKLNGYSTAQFGKCHEVPVWETSPMGPFDAWPTGSGFEYFYGFIGGEAHQYYPAIYEGTVPVEPEKTPEEGYHFMEDMTDKAIKWMRQQKALMPDKPFFAYFAPGATHAPHHVTPEWSDKYKGAFDDGWDALRERTFARQKELGVIPADAELTARHEEIPAWDEMPDHLKPVLRRQMEIYAGFLEFTDHHVGRLIDALEDLGVLENTLVYYIIGDNGASAEGTVNGTYNEMINFNGAAALETPEFMMERLDDFGGPDSYNHYSVGWAHALCAPYQWTKQVASHWGGTRNGTIVHWPAGIKARGEVPLAVLPRDRRRPDGAGGGRAPRACVRQRRPAEAVRGREHGLLLRRRHGVRTAHDPVLRDVLQPGHLPRGLDGRDATRDTVAPRRDGSARRRRLGAVRHEHRLDAVAGPGQGAAAEARRPPAPVPDRGGEVQRPAARRPADGAVHPRAGRPADAHPGGSPASLRRDGAALGALRRRHQEQVARRHGRARGSRGRRRGRDHRPGRQHRRVEPLPQGRQAAVLLQPAWDPALLRRLRQEGPGGNAPGADGVRLRRRRAGGRAARSRSISTVWA